MGKGERDKFGAGDWNIHTIIYKIDKQQSLLYSTGNYTQYLVIIYNGKESEKEYMHTHTHTRGFPGGSFSKEFTCNAGEPGLIPGSGRSHGEGNGNPLQYSCLENSMDGEESSLVSYSSWNHKELDTTEWLTIHFHIYSYIHMYISKSFCSTPETNTML